MSAPSARGSVNNDDGRRCTSSGVEWLSPRATRLEPWYDPAEVVGPNVWKPDKVIPGTLPLQRASCCRNLPLNADILGLDPVRLPSDGRVPIYRPADVVVIHNTKSYALPNPAVAGATYNVGRANLSERGCSTQPARE